MWNVEEGGGCSRLYTEVMLSRTSLYVWCAGGRTGPHELGPPEHAGLHGQSWWMWWRAGACTCSSPVSRAALPSQGSAEQAGCGSLWGWGEFTHSLAILRLQCHSWWWLDPSWPHWACVEWIWPSTIRPGSPGSKLPSWQTGCLAEDKLCPSVWSRGPHATFSERSGRVGRAGLGLPHSPLGL